MNGWMDEQEYSLLIGQVVSFSNSTVFKYNDILKPNMKY